MSELWRLCATDIAVRVRSGEVCAREVAEDALSRLEQVNPRINAIVAYRPDDVRARARALDELPANRRAALPLAGVPVTIKVSIDQAGYATTNGLVSRRDLVAASNNPLVDRLLEAGAILLGRTNTPAFSYRWFTSNLLHGHTYNPRNRQLTPGGSSGGAAAGVAAGLGCIGMGTDIGGSVRYPAYACGVHGLRPTVGRVAMYNASVGDRGIGGQLMAVAGPIARSIGDLRLALQVVGQADARDPCSVPAPLEYPDSPREAVFCLRPDGLETEPAVVEAVSAAAARLAEAGWIVREVDDLPPLREARDLQVRSWLGDGYESLVAAAEREGDPGAIVTLRGQAAMAPSGDRAGWLSQALVRRMAIARAWHLFLREHPVILLPVSAELPFDDDLDMQGDQAYARVCNAQTPMTGLPVAGVPALVLNTGAVNGRPVGVQIVAGRFREDLCLAAGAAIERLSSRLPLADAVDQR